MTILSEQYKTIASIYDELNADAIDQLSVNLISFMEELKFTSSTVLDLGCGSGRLLRNLQTTIPYCAGCDLSPEMISEARKLSPRINKIECSSMLDLKPDRCFELIICTNDAINYLKPIEWNVLFGKIKQWLHPGGYFYFDFTTNLDIRTVWPHYRDYLEGNGWFCCKINEYDIDQKAGIERQVWFVKQGKDYVRFEEQHTLYGPTLHEIKMFSKNADLFIKHIINPISFRKSDPENLLRIGMFITTA